jgi:GT2 family glycosyltransferase
MRIPFVSIVVPAYNREDFLPACLFSLCSQTYPSARYEIILVDDGSTDGTADVAREILQQWAGTFQVIQKPNGGPASARNTGILAAGGECIAFIDADCVAERDWLEQLISILWDTNAAGVGGPLVNISPKAWVPYYLSASSFFRHRVRHGQVDYLLTANVAFRRSALLQVHGFSERPGIWSEDADLSFRLIQAGYKLLLAESGVVSHFGTPLSLRSLIKNLYRYGYGNAVLSVNWKNGRTPATELLRHGGAVVLSPFLALGKTRHVGVLWAMAFWPLVVMEHTAFVVGLVSGMLSHIGQGSNLWRKVPS